MQEKNDDFINVLPAEMVEKILDYLKPNELVTALWLQKRPFLKRLKENLH